MQLLGHLLAYLLAPLAALSLALAPILFGHRQPTDGDFVVAALIVSTAVMAAFCSVWGATQHVRLLQLRQSALNEEARARSVQLFHEAIIEAAGQPIVVMGVGMSAPLSFSGGHELLQACLAGPDAAKTAAALEALLEHGTGFERHTLSGMRQSVHLRGTTIGGRVAVFFRPEAKNDDLDGRGILEALPVPVWVRNRDLSLHWVNDAFLCATGQASFEHAIAANWAFDRTEIELATAALEDDEAVEAKRYAMVAGERRALSLTLQPIANAGVAGVAVDVTDVAQTEMKLRAHIENLNGVLDSLETAIVAFDSERKLVAFNRAFREMWDLPTKWLNHHPTTSEVWERLREERLLPEQRDFSAWRRRLNEMFGTLEEPFETLWHLPDGRSLRVVVEPNGFGGLTFRFVDVSEKLRQESAFNTLLKVQKATLDTMDDGVAVVGPDGRINLWNAAFATLWSLTDDELAGRPHIRRVAEWCASRIGRDQTWEIIASGVAAGEPERLNEWGKIGRSDGKAISLTLARLPDGSTLATFVDMTEAIRFERELRRTEVQVA